MNTSSLRPADAGHNPCATESPTVADVDFDAWLDEHARRNAVVGWNAMTPEQQAVMDFDQLYQAQRASIRGQKGGL